ncbi:hypothetical protein [Streptomyces sp. YKOK-J1]
MSQDAITFRGCASNEVSDVRRTLSNLDHYGMRAAQSFDALRTGIKTMMVRVR